MKKKCFLFGFILVSAIPLTACGIHSGAFEYYYNSNEFEDVLEDVLDDLKEGMEEIEEYFSWGKNGLTFHDEDSEVSIGWNGIYLKDEDIEADIGWNGIYLKDEDIEADIGWNGIHVKDGDSKAYIDGNGIYVRDDNTTVHIEFDSAYKSWNQIRREWKGMNWNESFKGFGNDADIVYEEIINIDRDLVKMQYGKNILLIDRDALLTKEEKNRIKLKDGSLYIKNIENCIIINHFGVEVETNKDKENDQYSWKKIGIDPSDHTIHIQKDRIQIKKGDKIFMIDNKGNCK